MISGYRNQAKDGNKQMNFSNLKLNETKEVVTETSVIEVTRHGRGATARVIWDVKGREESFFASTAQIAFSVVKNRLNEKVGATA